MEVGWLDQWKFRQYLEVFNDLSATVREVPYQDVVITYGDGVTKVKDSLIYGVEGQLYVRLSPGDYYIYYAIGKEE